MIGGMVLVSAFLFSGQVESGALTADAALLAELKDQEIDAEQPTRLQVEVDYAAGAAAPWFPKAESPVLRGLVAAGALPPVAERVGPEPLVLRGIEGAGSYGGDMLQLKDTGDWRMKPVGLVRWSPQGYPIVPNVAKAWTVEDGGRVYTFTLRRGMRWATGRPSPRPISCSGGRTSGWIAKSTPAHRPVNGCIGESLPWWKPRTPSLCASPSPSRIRCFSSSWRAPRKPASLPGIFFSPSTRPSGTRS